MVTYLIPEQRRRPHQRARFDGGKATVGKDQITAQEVGKVVTNLTQSRQMPPQLLAIYVPQIVQQMISERAMAYEAKRLGLRVSADETENAVMDTIPPQLIKDGKVDSATLNAVLAQQGVSMAQVKDDTARQLLVGRLRQIVAEGVVVSPQELEAAFHEKNDKTKIQYALLMPGRNSRRNRKPRTQRFRLITRPTKPLSRMRRKAQPGNHSGGSRKAEAGHSDRRRSCGRDYNSNL